MLDDVSTLRALDAEERIELLRTGHPIPSSADPRSPLLEEWRSMRTYREFGADFAERLQSLGISAAELRQALDLAASDAVDSRARAYLQAAVPAIATSLVDPHAASEPLNSASLVALASPLLHAQLMRFEAGLETLAARHPARFAARAVLRDNARLQLGREFKQLCYRSCTLELHVAKLRGQLQGDTPEARFVDFVRRLGLPEVRRELFAEYQGLYRLLAVRAEAWLTHTLEWLGRLADDAPALEAFGVSRGAGLTGWQGGLGDSHRGRSVVLLEFAGGAKLVYKPRSVSSEAGFAAFVAWFNSRSGDLPLRAAQVVDRGSYGWCAFVATEAVDDLDAAARFFRRQGMFLAIFHALSTGDLHHENVIACGEHPVYIDLETMLHPLLTGDDACCGERPFGECWPFTVADTLLAPGTAVRSAVDGRGADVSPLGASEEIEWPTPIDAAEGAGTDELRIVRRRMTTRAGHHRPRLDGALTDTRAHLDEVRAGFRAAYRLLLRERASLLEPDGFDRWFAAVRLRYVVRPTMVYTTLLDATLHPDYQRDWTERRIQFERLWPGRDTPWLRRVFDAELRDLLQQDVPYFTRDWHGKALFDSRGEAIPGFFAHSPRQLLQAQLGGLSEAEMHAQLRILDVGFSRPDPSQAAALGIGGARPPLTGGLQARALASAARLSDMLAASAIRRGNDVYWHVQAALGEGEAIMTPAALDLYTGQLGVVWQLAVQSRLTSDPALERLARSALHTTLRWAGPALRPFIGIGAQEGAMCVPYVLGNLAQLWQQPALLDRAFALLAAARFDRSDDRFDLMAGGAGALLAADGLLRLARTDAEAGLVRHRMSHWCAQLAAAARPADGGLGWKTLPGEIPPLAGYSHGASGIAVALAKAAVALRRPDLVPLVTGALDFERAQFDERYGNWLDRRRAPDASPSERAGIHAWCHGAPGIALARAQLLDLLEQDDGGALVELRARRSELADDLDRAVLAVQKRGLQGGHCLCHGALGNWLCLRHAARHHADARRWLPGALAALLSDAAQHGWRAGDLLDSHDTTLLYAPGFMTGAAGIANGLLIASGAMPLPDLIALEMAHRIQ